MNKELYDNFLANSDIERQRAEAANLGMAQQIYEQNQQHQAILVEQTNPIKVIEEVALRLKGKIKNYDGSVIIEGEPLMNSLGVNRMMYMMASLVNQNTILSHLENEEIGKVMMQFSDDITDDLTLNWRAYGIVDKSTLDFIVDSIIFPCYFALKRALEQNEKNWLGKISVENISNAPRMPGKKDSFWSKFKL